MVTQTHRALRAAIIASAGILGSCSLLYDTSATQCAVDSDCPSPSSGGNVQLLVCRANVCVAETSDSGLPDSGEDGSVVETLPFVLDTGFVATGYMGDGENGAVVGATSCPMRAGEARGLCHQFTYTRPTPAGSGWAGVYWQSPANNWGTMPGYVIPQGAKSIAFYAWSDQPSLPATFQAGIAAADGFEVQSAGITLTNTPQRFVLSLGGATYTDVVGGFAWTSNQPSGSAHVIFVDDIVWVDEDVPVDVTFAVDANAPLGVGCAMHVFGSFNEWSIDAVTMTGPGAGDVFTATVSLPAGTRIEYLFAQKCNGTETVETMTSGTPCTLTTGAFTNRTLVVPTADATLGTVCRGSCGACP